MLKLKAERPIEINCTIRLSPELTQKLNCAAKPDLTPKQVAKIVQQTPESNFILDCFKSGAGSSPASIRFHQAVDSYNKQYNADITDAKLVRLIKEWCSKHGYNEHFSKKGASTGGRYDGKNLYIYKLPMQALFAKNPDGRGTVMDGRVTHGDGIDRLYIKLSIEQAGDPIDVVSYHRDSDATNQRYATVTPEYDKPKQPKQKPNEADAEEGQLEEQPEKVAARAAYEKRHRG